MKRSIVTVLTNISYNLQFDSDIEFSDYKRENKALEKYRKDDVYGLYKSTRYKAL